MTNIVWFDDAYPANTTTGGIGTDPTAWLWSTSNPSPSSGSKSLKSDLLATERSMRVSRESSTVNNGTAYYAFQPFEILSGESLAFRVRLDPANPPTAFGMDWWYPVPPPPPPAVEAPWDWAFDPPGNYDDSYLAPGAKWGPYNGFLGGAQYTGTLPAAGSWVTLTVPANVLGVAGKKLMGVSFVLQNGRAWFDRIGKIRPMPPGTGPITLQTVTKYYTFGGQRVAMARGIDFYYLHADHLGSVVSMTGLNNATAGIQRYSGYGKTRSATQVLTDYQFQGQKQDATGLQYFNARYFDPQTGTFISPDTLIPDTSDVFSYNRYMAFRGNPIKYTDPSGHFAWIAAFAVAGAVVGAGIYAYNEINYGDGLNSWSDVGNLALAAGGGAVAGMTIAIAPVIAAEAIGAGLTGVGVATGSTALFAAGTRANEIAAAGNALLFGGAAVASAAQSVPSAQSQAENKAAELRSQGGKLPTATSAAVDSKTGKTYYGFSGTKATVKSPTMQTHMASPSLEPWPVDNCAEFNACNTALLDGAKMKDLIIHTVRTKSGVPYPRCLNCQITTSGATVTSD